MTSFPVIAFFFFLSVVSPPMPTHVSCTPFIFSVSSPKRSVQKKDFQQMHYSIHWNITIYTGVSTSEQNMILIIENVFYFNAGSKVIFCMKIQLTCSFDLQTD